MWRYILFVPLKAVPHTGKLKLPRTTNTYGTVFHSTPFWRETISKRFKTPRTSFCWCLLYSARLSVNRKSTTLLFRFYCRRNAQASRFRRHCLTGFLNSAKPPTHRATSFPYFFWPARDAEVDRLHHGSISVKLRFLSDAMLRKKQLLVHPDGGYDMPLLVRLAHLMARAL